MRNRVTGGHAVVIGAFSYSADAPPGDCSPRAYMNLTALVPTIAVTASPVIVWVNIAA